jgi:hypothetical protein
MKPTVTIPPRVLRLADQLGFDPETLAAAILDGASVSVDWSLSTGAHPLDFGMEPEALRVSAQLDRMTAAQREALTADSDKTPQAVLTDRDRIRHGLRTNDDETDSDSEVDSDAADWWK